MEKVINNATLNSISLPILSILSMMQGSEEREGEKLR